MGKQLSKAIIVSVMVLAMAMPASAAPKTYVMDGFCMDKDVPGQFVSSLLDVGTMREIRQLLKYYKRELCVDLRQSPGNVPIIQPTDSDPGYYWVLPLED